MNQFTLPSATRLVMETREKINKRKNKKNGRYSSDTFDQFVFKFHLNLVYSHLFYLLSLEGNYEVMCRVNVDLH